MSEELVLKFVDPKPMRYGENSHQSAVFYRDPTCTEASLATAKQLWGKELSYNNIVDADAALEMAREFCDDNAVVIVKHMNPCGLATGKTLRNAMEAAWEGDPVSAFGSVIAVTKKIRGYASSRNLWNFSNSFQSTREESLLEIVLN